MGEDDAAKIPLQEDDAEGIILQTYEAAGGVLILFNPIKVEKNAASEKYANDTMQPIQAGWSQTTLNKCPSAFNKADCYELGVCWNWDCEGDHYVQFVPF